MQGHPVNVKHDARYDMAKAGGGDQKKNKQEDFNLLLLSVA